MSSVSQRIRYYRKKSGMTQMDVASKLGIRTDNYAKYESGARIPRADRLIELSKILGVSYDALNEGVEREFADLLKSHAIGMIVDEPGAFLMLISDMQQSPEAYGVISDFFDRGLHSFQGNNPQFCQKYLSEPNLAALIELYGVYREQCDSNSASNQINGISLKMNWLLTPLEPVITVKLGFCIAVKRYLERNDTGFIINETEEFSADFREHIGAIQFLAVKILIPYLSFIIDAVELCMNTTIDDFEKAFLFYALTHPDDEIDNSGDGNENDPFDDEEDI